MSPQNNIPLISVIIVSWNVADSLSRCLSSVLATKYEKLEIIVIDNHSSDKSVSTVSAFRDSRITLIKNFKNLGFPKAVNQGLEAAAGDFFLLLNPDARIPKDFFQEVLQFLRAHPKTLLVGPKLADPDGTPQGSVFPEPSLTRAIGEFWFGKSGLTAKFTPSGQSPVLVNAVSGACMFFPRKTLNLVGRLTESVFMYYEDLDFCRRIRQKGGEIYFLPEVVVIHEHGQSSAQISGRASNYLVSSSLWYNGAIKHYLLWFISWTGQKFRALFHSR